MGCQFFLLRPVDAYEVDSNGFCPAIFHLVVTDVDHPLRDETLYRRQGCLENRWVRLLRINLVTADHMMNEWCNGECIKQGRESSIPVGHDHDGDIQVVQLFQEGEAVGK